MQLRILAMVLVMIDQLPLTIKLSQDGRQKIYIISYNLGRVFVCGGLLCKYSPEKLDVFLTVHHELTIY